MVESQGHQHLHSLGRERGSQSGPENWPTGIEGPPSRGVAKLQPCPRCFAEDTLSQVPRLSLTLLLLTSGFPYK